MEPATKKLKSDSSKNFTHVELEQTDNQKPQTVILNYDALRIVFKFLKATALLKAGCVCKSWKIAAADELASRQCPVFKVAKFAASNASKDSPTYSARDLADSLSIKPHLGFVFCKLNKGNKDWTPEKCFCSYLPSTCQPLTILTSYDIIGDNNVTGTKNELAVTAFLPQIPNLKVKKFRCNESLSSFSEKNEKKLFQEAKNFFKDSVWNCKEKSKCIIFLTNYDAHIFSEHMVEYILNTYEPGTLSLWGGIPSNLKNCASKNSDGETKMISNCLTSAVCTIMCLSSPSLQSWSVVLPQRCMSANDMEKKLRNFKESIELKKYTLALMCACIAREKNKEKEIKVFNKVFPEVILVGFLGDGEYGLDTLKKEREKDIQLGYSTVFLILTYE